MKKAKMMLSALAVVAVVGGALAFKASSKNATFFPIQPDQKCTVAVQGTISASPTVPVSAYNTVSSDECPFSDRFTTVE